MNPRQRFYAIREKGTNRYLPEVGRGYTHSEPEAFSVPRLFLDKAGAKRALTWWRKGATTVTHTKSTSIEWMGYEYDEDWHTEEKPDRQTVPMEIVTFMMQEVIGGND